MDIFSQDSEHLYKNYQKFFRRADYERASKYLERLLKRYPDDEELLEEMISLCVHGKRDGKAAKHWLKKRLQLAPNLRDYAALIEIEIETGSLQKAKEYLKIAEHHEKHGEWAYNTMPEKEAAKLIKLLNKFIGSEEKIRSIDAQYPEVKQLAMWEAAKKEAAQRSVSRHKPHEKKSEKETTAPVEKLPAPSLRLTVSLAPLQSEAVMELFQKNSTFMDCALRARYASLNVQREFDELLCLSAMKGVERYWYQVETVKRALKTYHGRVLLCDEVGLGKTIEAGMLLKEYVLRGMVKNALVLTPPSLVSQWKDEMAEKFGLSFATTDDALFQSNPKDFWKSPFIIASLHSAKHEKHFENVTGNFYDLVVVDEAHHLKNKRTLNWKLVNEIKKRFIFLLTATPVQNHLVELFNLITLLKPGQFKTERLFKKEFVQKGNKRVPVNKEALRLLLKEVMIRNTRSVIDLKLPRRFAKTFRLEPSPRESKLYDALSAALKSAEQSVPKTMTQLLLREAGSSPRALQDTLLRLKGNFPALSLVSGIVPLGGETSKTKALLELVLKNTDAKKIIFTQYFKTMEDVTALLTRHGIPFATFRGDMTAKEKDEAILRFREDVPILVSSESGGEGRNIQFCNTLINYDLPWNPMRIEQRIGRLHRIGQTQDVFVFNLTVKGTLEDYIVEVLDSKMNMFELVIGEIEPILGFLDEEKEFESLILDIWEKAHTPDDVQKGFTDFGEKLLQAKKHYLQTKALDNEIFGEDYEV